MPPAPVKQNITGPQWGRCWFSRNTNLWTRSGPEGSSRSRWRVCRDVAGSVPTYFLPCLALLFAYSFFSCAKMSERSIVGYRHGKRITYSHSASIIL